MFTPGGDLIYSIDPSKQGHWHMDLCVALQQMLGLPEPPHFLVPGYTATIDRWLDPRTQKIRTSAEIYRPVLRHQELLNAVFGCSNLVWQVAPWEEGSCDPIVLETYREQFPQLWEDHDLIVHFERPQSLSYSFPEGYPRGYLQEYAQPQGLTAENPSSLDVTVSHPAIDTLLSANPIPEGATVNSESSDNCEEVDEPFPPPVSHNYVLRLFVSGHSAATEQTLKSLHQLLEHTLLHPYTLKVIDVFKHPEQAEENQISATPTLLRLWPQPVRRLVGDLNDIDKILRILSFPDKG